MKKILVVDDNTSIRELVDMVFGGDFKVFVARDGEDGFNMAAEHKPDLILLDVMMPRVSGVEMLRRLQGDAELRSIPVIILTASKLDASTQDMLVREPNVRSFLTKPCAISELRSKIIAALENRAVT